MSTSLSATDLKSFSTVNANSKPLGEATDYVKSNLTDTLCSIIPFGSFFRNVFSKVSDKIMNTEIGKKIVSVVSDAWNGLLQMVGKLTKSPMPSIEASLNADSSKIIDSCTKTAEAIKGKDDKPLFTGDELKTALNMGVKENITFAGTLSGWSFDMLDKPKAQDIAASVYNNVNQLALSKLVAELPESQRASPPDAVIMRAHKIAESISGVKVTEVGTEKDKHKFAPSETHKQGTALSYFTGIYPAEGNNAAVDSSKTPFAPSAPQEASANADAAKKAAKGAATAEGVQGGTDTEAPAAPAHKGGKAPAKKAPAMTS